MNKPHKHAEVIKAWADGAEIEFRIPSTEGGWMSAVSPSWTEHFEYRVKPQPKKYKVGVWLVFREDGSLISTETAYPFKSHKTDYIVYHTLEGELPNV